MYYNQQPPQAPALPFDPRAPQYPFLNLNLSYPPFVPANIQTEPQLQPYVPLVSAMAAIEIQGQAQRNPNPLRMFMFNQTAANSFANPEFETIIAGILDYALLLLMKRQANNPEQAVQLAVPKVVEMVCAMNFQLFPALEAHLPKDMAYAARGTINEFNNFAQEIHGMKQRLANPYGQGAPSNYPPAAPYGNAYPVNQQGRAGWPPTGSPPPAVWEQRGPGVQPSQGNTGLFNGGRPAGNLSGNPQQREMSGRYEKLGQREQPPVSRSTDVPSIAQPFTSRSNTVNLQESVTQASSFDQLPFEEEPTLVLASSGTIKWKPSMEYPYFPAYNPQTHVLYLEKQTDGTTRPVLKIRTSDMLDYDRHATPTVFGPIPTKLKLAQTAELLERVERGTRELNGEIRDTDEEVDQPAPVVFVKEKWITDTSERNAWLETSLERMEKQYNQGNPDVFRAYARLAEPIVSANDENATVKNFGSSHTFVELREKLNGCVNEISPELWTATNRKMTGVVNRILRQNLSIPVIYIESFVSDIGDLIELIGKRYGEPIKEAFLKFEREHIQQAFVSLTDETTQLLTSGLLDTHDYEAGKEPKITYLASDYSLTYLNCRAHELALELSSDGGSAITKAITPAMFALVDHLFKETEVIGQFYRHLIRTNDGYVMEATKGYIGSDFYLLTLVEQ